jgi:phage recombination protein Bet
MTWKEAMSDSKTITKRKQSSVEKPVVFMPLGEKQEVELTMNTVKKYIANPTRQGNMPSDGDIIRFMMLCRARQLNPWTGDAYLIGYDSRNGPEFNLITSIQALLKRAESNENYDGHKAGIIVRYEDADGSRVFEKREGSFRDDDEILVGGWADVYRKDRKQEFHVELKLGTYSKGNSQWQKDGEGMIRKCALAAGLREAFPNLVAGLYTADEMQDRPPTEPNRTLTVDDTPELPTPQEVTMDTILEGDLDTVEPEHPRPNQPETEPEHATGEIPDDPAKYVSAAWLKKLRAAKTLARINKLEQEAISEGEDPGSVTMLCSEQAGKLSDKKASEDVPEPPADKKSEQLFE